jgi:phosphatidylglycerol:prolipoprotein diacylglycerol transferase
MCPEINIFGLTIHMYGLWFCIGVIVCLIFTTFAMKKCGYSKTAIDVIIIIGVFAILIGILSGMLFQAVYNYINNPSEGFSLDGGMTFIGGLIGGVIAFLALYFIYVYAINPKLKDSNYFKSDMNKGVWYLVRIAPISITTAHGFGRIGCLFAGCCHGKPTHEWYGIHSANAGETVIPLQLYEALFLFALSAVLIVLLFKFHSKDTMSIYLVSYGIWRFVIEYFRDDYRGSFIPGLSPSQFWSILMVIGGIAFFFIYRYFDNKIEQKQKEKETQAE